MHVNSLESTPIEIIFDCFMTSFESYFVSFPNDLNYFKKRWQATGIDFSYSFGMFDQDKLVGFMLQAIGKYEGQLTAYNAGTGVIPSYRKQGVVAKLYDEAIPILQAKGVEACMLEVIKENEPAIRSYKRIGFKKTAELPCFGGEINIQGAFSLEVEVLDLTEQLDKIKEPALYSWDNTFSVLSNSSFDFIKVTENKLPLGYIIVDLDTGYIAQLEAYSQQENEYIKLLYALKQKVNPVKMNNVNSIQKAKLAALKKGGLKSPITQYLMHLTL